MSTSMHIVVKGRLVDETGAGVANQRVELHKLFSTPWLWDLRATATTAVTGHFVVEGTVTTEPAPSVTRLLVVMPDPVGRRVHWQDFDASVDPIELGIIVCPRAELEGWLVTLGTGEAQHLYHGNHGEWFVDNDVLWPQLLGEFEQAQHSIHVTQLFWDLEPEGSITRRLADAALAASRRGVEVRVQLNDFPIDVNETLSQIDDWTDWMAEQPEPLAQFTVGSVILGLLSLHAKLIVIDGVRAYSLGSPLKTEMFDDSHHRVAHPPRGALKTKGSGGGTQVAWHDVSFELRGAAVEGMDAMFALHWLLATNEEVPSMPASPAQPGGFSVQLVRTLPGQVYSTATVPHSSYGEQGILESYLRAFRYAGDFIYLENQYFTEPAITHGLLGALRQSPDLCIVMVLNSALDIPGWTGYQLEQIRQLYQRTIGLTPRLAATLDGSLVAGGYSDVTQLREALRLGGVWVSRSISVVETDTARWHVHDTHTLEVLELRQEAHGIDVYRPRVGLFQLYKVEPATETQPTTVMPIYVHSKVGIIDDCWATVGSANLDGASLNWSETAAHWNFPRNYRPTGVERNVELNATFFDNIAGCPPCDMPRQLRERLFGEHLHGASGGALTPPGAGETWLDVFRRRATGRLLGLHDAPSQAGDDRRVMPWLTPTTLCGAHELERLGITTGNERVILRTKYDDTGAVS